MALIEKLKNRPLKEKLIFGGMVSVMIPFCIVGIIIYVQLSNSLIEIAKESVHHYTKDIAGVINDTLTQELRLAQSLAADPDTLEAVLTDDFSKVQFEIEAIFNRIGKHYQTFFLTDKNGIARADAFFTNQIGINLSDRDYFIKAKSGHSSIVGPIVPKGNATSGGTIIVVATPILYEGNFFGIVAIPLNIEFLNNILSQGKLGKTGHAFLVDSQGALIAHSDMQMMHQLKHHNQSEAEIVKELLENKVKPVGSSSFQINDKIVGLDFVTLNGWIAVFEQDRSEAISPVRHILYSIIICALLFLFCTILFIAFASQRFGSTIQKLLELREQVTKHTTDTILQIGLDRKIKFANPAFEKITGLKTKDILGTQPCLENSTHTPSTEVWKHLETGQSWSGRVSIKNKFSKSIILAVMLMPIRNDKGQIYEYLQIGRDITEELTYEKRLLQSQKLEAVGTLAGGIAHDFNNILSAIFGYAELSLMAKNLPSEAQKFIKLILAASERARDLVNQILTYSRNSEVELKALMPKSVIKEGLKLLRASISTKIDINEKINSDAVILADPTQLHQVVMNLFMNAFHAIGDRSGTITIELDDFLVDEAFTKTHPDIKPGKHIRIRVTDTGCGIEPEIVDQIFEPFFTTKSMDEGTGLGLSVVHGIVKKIGGIITVYSQIGQGTVFNIIIPCADTHKAKAGEKKLALFGGTEKIVIIDDEKAIATSMKFILSNLGYQVTSFTDSVEALEAIKEKTNDIDLIITDNSMPNMTGIEVAEHLEANGIDIPIILTSGFFEKNTEDVAKRAGIKELIPKPFVTFQVLAAIRRSLANKNEISSHQK